MDGSFQGSGCDGGTGQGSPSCPGAWCAFPAHLKGEIDNFRVTVEINLPGIELTGTINW